MEGLRKGSLFPFLETGRGEESGSRLPCIRRATRQEGSLPVSCASVFLSLPAFWGSDASLPGVRSPPAGLPPFADFACFPGADGLSAPTRRPLRHAGKSGGAAAMRRMPHRRQLSLLQWSSPVFTHGATIRCPILRIQAGMPRQDWRRHDSGTPWKERIFRP